MGKSKKAATSVVKADRKLSRKAAAQRDTPAVKRVEAAGDLADQPPLIVLSVVTILVGAVLRRPAVAKSGVRMLASHLIATGLKNVVKHSVDRTRPAKALDSGEHRFKTGDSREHDQTSFPSGHTAGAVAIASAVAHDAPGAALLVYAVAGAAAAAQLPSGKHYLLDTVAGAVVGYIGELVASAALRGAEAALAGIRRPQPSARQPDRSSPT
ncbi:phosphatase PAP2 family protein [Sphingomonas sp. PB4P5]|uniref:phosphatase PAP2 family protein n=1 Tax=Parasphingomonas puruogangriensis TaxID=3096155 RepID=UPI002FC964D5